MYLELIIKSISLAVGSFANNIISHLARKNNFDVFVSYCFCKERRLKLTENIPVFSYLINRGKCKGCGLSIPFRYLFVELFTVVLAIYLYSEYGLTMEFLYWFSIFSILFLIAVIDYLSFTIPNSLVLILLMIGLIGSRIPISEKITLLAYALILSLIFVFINKLLLVMKDKDGLGFGDIKLIFTLVLIFQLPDTLAGIWLGACVALLTILIKSWIQKREEIYSQRVPFGSFLVIGIFIVHLISDMITIYFKAIVGMYQ